MPRSARRAALLRGGGFLLAAALGVVGVWLIVTGNGSKTVRIGAICAFWGLLLGTYAMFGARPPSRAAEPAAPMPPAPPVPPPSRELDVRQLGEIERSAVAAARREFQQELQLMLRREVHDGFAQEVASLRAEVNALRSDLVEKVGGQLRLERIETTRLIGSDLEALQSELRKLRETAAETDAVTAPQDRLTAAVTVPGPVEHRAEAEHDIHEAEIVSDVAHGEHSAEPVAPPDVQPAAQPAAQPNVQPNVQPNAQPNVQPNVQPAVQSNAQPDWEPAPADPFAGMPRITPFTDFALDPVAPTPERASGPRSTRHRAEEGGHDVLARILAREQQ